MVVVLLQVILSLSEYKSLLNADGTGMMGYVTIPKIQVKLAIYHTLDESVLQIGVGHLEGSGVFL